MNTFHGMEHLGIVYSQKDYSTHAVWQTPCNSNNESEVPARITTTTSTTTTTKQLVLGGEEFSLVQMDINNFM